MSLIPNNIIPVDGKQNTCSLSTFRRLLFITQYPCTAYVSRCSGLSNPLPFPQNAIDGNSLNEYDDGDEMTNIIALVCSIVNYVSISTNIGTINPFVYRMNTQNECKCKMCTNQSNYTIHQFIFYAEARALWLKSIVCVCGL